MVNNNMVISDSNKSLKKLQKVELEILLEFDRICKENNLRYQLFAGTLLGAIRHKGFIPWDDDIDVCMLRKDYDKFINIASESIDDKYFIQTNKTDKEFINHFAKIRKNNTLFIQRNVANSNIHHGIYIDIFPYDNVNPKSFKGKIQRFILHALRKSGESRNKERCLLTKNYINRVIRFLIYYILKIIPKSSTDKLTDRIMRKFNDTETEYVADLSLSTDKKLYHKFVLKKQVFEESIYCNFEDYKFPIPKEYNYVLTRNYGDYMTLPKKENQISKHEIIEINFDVMSDN